MLRRSRPPEAVTEALSRWEDTLILVSHDAEFVEQLAPERVLLVMPDGSLDHWSDDFLELVTPA